MLRGAAFMIKAGFGTHAVGVQDRIEPALVLGKAAAVVLGVPQMKHRCGEAAALVFDAGVQEADDEVAVFEAPARIRFIKTVDAQEIVAPRGEIAGLHTFPALRRCAAPVAVAQPQQRQQAVDVAFAPRCEPVERAVAMQRQ